ncbi:MAG TPA: chromate transporter, partial [Ktedonobacterales bacterium]|nr:chromate transporter [Ktedonobacterales bacterium]
GRSALWPHLLWATQQHVAARYRETGYLMMDPLTYMLLFLKAALFSTGGFSNLPSLHQDLLMKGWANETEFGQSIAIGQISPGPNGLWVISLGYLTYGVLGAFLALIAVTIPPLLVLVIARSYSRIERWPRAQGAMRGVSIAVIGLLVTVIWTILHQPDVDLRGLPITAGAFLLAATRKVNIVLILALAGFVGYLMYR